MNDQYQTQPYNPPSQETRPTYPPENIEQYQTIRMSPPPKRRKKMLGCGSCGLALFLPVLLAFFLLAAYFLAPGRTNLLVLGIDRAPDGTTLGRSDTMILVSIDPLRPIVNMLSIPRDLWVNIPGVGDNRINTAHFFAKSQEAGSGPAAAVKTVEDNFDVEIPNYVRVRFDSLQLIVEALGGVSINLPKGMGGLEAGQHHLNGEQALAFVRDRKGTDDFFRMAQGQVMVKAIAIQVLSPASWSRWPQVLEAVSASVDTNLPFWQWPRLGFAVLRAGIGDSINNTTIQREMTQSYITSGGADVLLPNWDLIHPLVKEMLGQ